MFCYILDISMKRIIVVIYISSYLNFVATTRQQDKLRRVLRLLNDNRDNNIIRRIIPPESHEFLAGHTLIRPSKTMLTSAIKYPVNEKNLVYGNLANLGIALGDAPNTVLHSGFRKGNNLKKSLLKAIKKIAQYKKNYKKPIHKVQFKENSKKESLDMKMKKVQEFLSNHISGIQAKLPLKQKTKYIQDFLNNKSPAHFNRTWIRNVKHPNFRRLSRSKKNRRNRDSKYISKEDSGSFTSSESDYERNPGNPYTVHKSKYKQNWMWNHFMDGDHMNVNPLGPRFSNMGPSGPDLFFGRKWWYYNQDDYRPLG